MLVDTWCADRPPADSGGDLAALEVAEEFLPFGVGHYRAKLVRDTDADAALVFYLTKADPLLVLRDLLGHSSVLVTEKYLKRLDTTRIYQEAYETAGAAEGLVAHADAQVQADAEFAGEVC